MVDPFGGDDSSRQSRRRDASLKRGNPPELQARLDAMCGTARAKLEELRRPNTPEAKDDGHSRGH